jgi:hypothetical protein
VRPKFPVGVSRYLSLATHLVAEEHGVKCHHVLLFKLDLKLPPTIPGLEIEKMQGERQRLWQYDRASSKASKSRSSKRNLYVHCWDRLIQFSAFLAQQCACNG